MGMLAVRLLSRAEMRQGVRLARPQSALLPKTPARPFSSTRLASVAQDDAVDRKTASSASQSDKNSWWSIRGAVLLGIFGASSYVLGSMYPPETISLLFPAPAAPLPQAGSAEESAYRAKLEKEMLNLPQVRMLLASASPVAVSSPQAQEEPRGSENPSTHVNALETTITKAHYVLSRPFAKFPEDMRQHSLTAGSLRHPGMLAVPPVVLSKTRHGARVEGGEQGDGFAFVHLGQNLCGHKGIVHGGLLATVLDETLARTAFYHLPHHIGVTARLEIDYKAPVRANTVVVVETRTIEHQGRKAWVEATMRDLRGQTLVQSKALFVEPRMAKWLDISAVGKVMDRQDE